jgi:Mn-dependent DtxR family transcriptional regulator
VLANLYALAAQHEDQGHAHSIQVLRAMNAGRGGVQLSLAALKEKGLVRETGDSEWALTPKGRDVAEDLMERQG